ncbi:MAG: hypothetical protein IKW91_04975 [Bacteroidaceae bacterium]|nr:hypothetical protein [Bacteroidaceae bacterium]
MKKIYNQPTCLVVALGTCKMMAESFTIYSDGGTIGSSDEILVKEENTLSDINLWDEEW